MKLTKHSELFLALALIAGVGAGCGGLPKHLTQVERIQAPPAGKALVNFHRPSGWGGNQLYPIFDINGTMLIDLPGASEYQQVCAPGENIFMGWAEHVSVVKADLAPDKVYDIILDVSMGWVKGNIYMVPLTRAEPRRSKVAEFESREKLVLGLNRNSPHVTEYETKQRERVDEIKRDFVNGGKAERVKLMQKDDCR